MWEMNVALDLFAIVILLIIFFSCLSEYIKKENKSKLFLAILILLTMTLISDATFWVFNNNVSARPVTLVSRTLTVIFVCAAGSLIVHQVRRSTIPKNKFVSTVIFMFDIYTAAFVALLLYNMKYGVVFEIDENGAHSLCDYSWIFYAILFAFLFIMMITIPIVSKIRFRYRLLFALTLLFPLAGIALDYFSGKTSMLCIGLVVSAIIIYTSIYQQKRYTISEQKNALMLSQINPHFMYNTLTAIASLCDISPKEAKGLIIDFSTFLRHNIDTLTSNRLIPFEQELRHIGCYLKIEKARFQERLNVVYAIQAKDFSIPALTVQPLVENAVKSGILQKKEGGTVVIATYATEKKYLIEIRDDGVGFDVDAVKADGKTHVGIENVRNRLKDMCKGTLSVKSEIGVGTRVWIEIPRTKEAKR